MTPFMTVKAFDKDYNEIPFAVEEGDFTIRIPVDCVLKKIAVKPDTHNEEDETAMGGFFGDEK